MTFRCGHRLSRRGVRVSLILDEIITEKDVFLSVFDNPLLNAQIAAAMPKAGPAILPILRHTILREAPEVVAPPALALFQRQPRI